MNPLIPASTRTCARTLNPNIHSHTHITRRHALHKLTHRKNVNAHVYAYNPVFTSRAVRRRAAAGGRQSSDIGWERSGSVATCSSRQRRVGSVATCSSRQRRGGSVATRSSQWRWCHLIVK